MQLTDRIKNCNGCGACVVGCKYHCIKMERDAAGHAYPRVQEDGCQKCNNCILYCPLFNPVELPEFANFYETENGASPLDREMPKLLRETMRSVKSGAVTEFTGTLCQIAALKSLMGDRLHHNLHLYPLYCDPEHPRRPSCGDCPFVRKAEKA